MCLALFRFDPLDDWPFLLVSIRDEDLNRPAAEPHTWWPQTAPGVVGGRDLRAGGTWLAIDPGQRAVAAVFTPAGPTPRGSAHRSRGELPLAALAGDGLDSRDLSAYLPFALLRADAVAPTWWSWNGSRMQQQPISPGVHVANIDGLDATSTSRRQARWLAPFAAHVPEPFRRRETPESTWGQWLRLIDNGLEPERDDSLLLRRTLPSGSYGTRSVALVAIGKGDLGYDVTDRPGSGSWTSVALSR